MCKVHPGGKEERGRRGGWSHDRLGQNLRASGVKSDSSTKNNKVSNKNFKHGMILIYKRLI